MRGTQHYRRLFLLLLCLLFGLSATAPRSWEKIARDGSWGIRQEALRLPNAAVPEPQVIATVSATVSPLTVWPWTAADAPEPSVLLLRQAEQTVPVTRWTVSQAEALDLSCFVEAGPDLPEPSLATTVERTEPEVVETAAAAPSPAITVDDPPAEKVPAIAVDLAVDSRRLPEWNLPETLWPWLDIAAAHPSTAEWSSTVRHLIAELAYVQTQDDGDPQPILDELRRLANELEQIIESETDSEAQTQLRRMQHALLRRLDVWELVALLEQHKQSGPLAGALPQPPERTAARVNIPGLLRERTLEPRELLSLIERYETSGLASDARRVALYEQQLAASAIVRM